MGFIGDSPVVNGGSRAEPCGYAYITQGPKEPLRVSQPHDSITWFNYSIHGVYKQQPGGTLYESKYIQIYPNTSWKGTAPRQYHNPVIPVLFQKVQLDP